jgi:short-subunit dehydrogenase
LLHKVVIITGASSGIGKSLAYEFSKHGSKLVLGARRSDQTDVSNEVDCKNLILTAIEHYGKIDILINNAGISMRALFKNTELKVLNKLMDVNFWGTVYCTKYALPHILEQKGSVVGVSSIAGFKGLPARSGYSASKFAMSGFLEALRVENLKNDLHVLIAFPGFTTSNIRNTSLSADGSQQGESPRDEDKMMSSEDVAKHIYKAVLKRKSKIILTLQGKMIALIDKYFPYKLDNMIYNALAKEANSPFH